MLHLCIVLFVSLRPFGSALRMASQKSWDVALADVEASLAKECGNECLAVLHAVVNASSESSGRGAHTAMKALSEQGLERMEAAHGVMQAMSTSTGVVEGVRSGAHLATDTACTSPAECELRELAANKCTYGRVALQNTYHSLNVAAHVLGSLVSTLCGCVHVDHVSHCILQNVPAVCTFPYTVYSKVFAGSIQVWEAVKASTKSCMVHKGPAIQA